LLHTGGKRPWPSERKMGGSRRWVGAGDRIEQEIGSGDRIEQEIGLSKR